MNQETTNNDYQRLVANITKVNSLLQERVAESIADYGITPQQYYIMRIIKEAPGLSTMDIRDKLPDRFSDASRITDRMVSRGMIRKEQSKEDRRAVCVFLTEKGEEMLQRCHDKLKDETFGITKTDALILNQKLEKIKGDSSLS